MPPRSYETLLDEELPKLARIYQIDEDKAREIIWCESRNNPNAIGYNKDKDGNVWSKDWGAMQINDFYHLESAAKMHLDIHDPRDSLEYGMYLLSTQGYAPWIHSSKCHGLFNAQ